MDAFRWHDLRRTDATGHREAGTPTHEPKQLAVIANAPNPAGVALLKRGFSDETFGAGGLLLGALGPTAVAATAFLFL